MNQKIKQAEVTSMSSKGQVVIPNTIRRDLGIDHGAKLLVFTDGSNVLLKPIAEPSTKEFATLIARSRKLVKAKSITPARVKKAIKQARHAGSR